MGVVNAAEKPPLGKNFCRRRMRRGKRRVSPYRVGEKWLPLRQTASGPHVDFNARLYDPALGRFLSVDPMIGHPGSTQSINPYSYVENNPLNRTDPTGMVDCADNPSLCKTNLADAQKVTVNSNGSVSVTMKDGSTQTSGAGMMSSTEVAQFAAGAAARFGPSTVNFGNLSKMIKGLNPKDTSDHTKISSRTKAANMAGLSACVYSTSCNEMGNYHRTKSYSDSASGYKAALFQNGGSYALAFAGTDTHSFLGFSIPDLSDLRASVRQMMGLRSKQFDEAVGTTRGVLAMLGGNAQNLTLTGHSLGGALADVGALSQGVSAITFGAEWLSQGTIGRYGTYYSQASTLITSYYTAHDGIRSFETRMDYAGVMSVRPVGTIVNLPGGNHHVSSYCAQLGAYNCP